MTEELFKKLYYISHNDRRLVYCAVMRKVYSNHAKRYKQ